MGIRLNKEELLDDLAYMVSKDIKSLKKRRKNFDGTWDYFFILNNETYKVNLIITKKK